MNLQNQTMLIDTMIAQNPDVIISQYWKEVAFNNYMEAKDKKLANKVNLNFKLRVPVAKKPVGRNVKSNLDLLVFKK